MYRDLSEISSEIRIFLAHSQYCEKQLLTPSCLFACLSVFPRGTTQLPMGELSWHFIFEYFSKICPEKLSFIKTWQILRLLYVKTNIHFWSYCAQFFLEWEMFQTKVVEKIRRHFLPSNFFSENRTFYEMWKNIVEPRRPQITIWRMRIACWIPKSTKKQREYVILIASPLQQRLHERASMLRYTYIAWLANSGYPSSGHSVFTWTRMWGSIVIFRSQKDSASKTVWEPLL